jgi:hypothetical protein
MHEVREDTLVGGGDFVDHFLEMLKSKSSEPTSMFYGKGGRVSLQVALDNLIIGGDGVSTGMHSVLYAAARFYFFDFFVLN